MKNKKKWDGKMRGGIVGNSILLFIAKRLGISFCYFLIYPIAFYFLLFSKKGRDASKIYLKRRFKNIAGFKLIRYIYKHFYALGQNLFDRVLVMLYPNKFKDLTKGGEYIEEVVKNKTGAILLGAHIGNWELASKLFSKYDITINLMMYDHENEKIKKILQRENNNITRIISLDDPLQATLEAKEILKEGGLIAILGDRFMGESNTTKVKFLGKDARFSLGAFHLSYLTGAPIIFTFTLKINKKSYLFYADKPMYIKKANSKEEKEKNIYEVLQYYVKKIEYFLYKYPFQWFNFYDFWQND